MRTYLKKATKTSTTNASDVQSTVRKMLQEIEVGKDAVAQRFAKDLDNYSGPALLSEDAIQQAIKDIPQKLRDDMQFSHDNIRRFAEAQKKSMTDLEIEVSPGFIAGQRNIPVRAAGCYVPGGRYSHVASAMMTVTTAKVAGVQHITACSPPPRRSWRKPSYYLCSTVVRCR